MKKHVLIISHYFPPFAGGAITRVTKFVKYLPLYGWQSTVLTADKDFEEVPLDESLLKEVPANTEIYRIPSYEPVEFRKQVALKVKEKPGLKAKAYYFTRDLVSSYLLIPDRVLLWVFRAYGKAARIIQEKNIEIIFTTSPPHSLQILGLLLIKRTGKKWVTDFRDDWAGNPLFQKNRFFNKVQFFLERKVVQKADRIIVATPESRDKFLKNYPRMSPDKFVVISNGYDSETLKLPADNQGNSDKCVLLYTGSINHRRIEQSAFFKALGDLLSDNPDLKNNITVQFAGTVTPDVPEHPDVANLGNMVEFLGHLPHNELVTYLGNADVLLLILSEGEGVDTAVPGKLYEYLAIGKPVLAITPNGAATRLIQQCKAGDCVNPYDREKIKSALLDFYQAKRNGKLKKFKKSELINRFDRKVLTGKLAEVMDELMLHK